MFFIAVVNTVGYTPGGICCLQHFGWAEFWELKLLKTENKNNVFLESLCNTGPDVNEVAMLLVVQQVHNVLTKQQQRFFNVCPGALLSDVHLIKVIKNTRLSSGNLACCSRHSCHLSSSPLSLHSQRLPCLSSLFCSLYFSPFLSHPFPAFTSSLCRCVERGGPAVV